MKYFLNLLSIIFLTINTCNSQSKSETEDYIVINLNSLGLDCRNTIVGGYEKKEYKIRFFQNYLIIKEESYEIKNQKVTNFVSHKIIKLSNIKELEIKQFIDKDLEQDLKKRGVMPKSDIYSPNGVINFNNNVKKQGYYVEGKTDQEIEAFILNPLIDQFPGDSKIWFTFWSINENDKLNKIKKAFKHLISLNGGQLLEDLF